VSALELGVYQYGFGDVADLEWAGCDVLQAAPVADEEALAETPATRGLMR